MVGGSYYPDKRPNQGYWLRFGFESPRRHLVVSLFQDLISYRRFAGATFYIPCLDGGLKNHAYPFFPFFQPSIFLLLNLWSCARFLILNMECNLPAIFTKGLWVFLSISAATVADLDDICIPSF